MLSPCCAHTLQVRVLALAVKHWARCRGIADASDGTLSSYAWVVLVLHFLQHRVPAVLPSLMDPKLLHGAAKEQLHTGAAEGYAIEFFTDAERAREFLNTRSRADDGYTNTEPVAALLVGFFDYYGFKFNTLRCTIDSLSPRDWNSHISAGN